MTEEYKNIDAPSDICPACQTRSPRVYSQPKDSQGHNDMYVCDKCLYLWPTEWADAYRQVKHG